ncbi:serine/threonine-protein kinase, partial [Nocardioides pelophilus]|uniref:serine/threonine-protein kinase n=1 Tax=Nocardioides pelophilus TaxID=2172019 RepID=UPI0015FF0E71
MVAQFGVIKGRYALEEIIGSGGMGVVYRGRDEVLDRPIAVKMIRQELASEEFVKRFEREAAILARVRSPHIVVVYDYGQHEDQFFMVTDYLGEGDLAGWLERHGPMPVPEALALMARLADGLADAHELGVLHRDIKPANTLLWRRGGRLHPVLADFGIAVTSDLTLTKTGAVVGSPLYMAPERHLGQPATVASDIYAMGCLLYTLVTGDPPFWGGTEFQAANAHMNEPIPTVPADLPFAEEIDRVVADCMAKRPGDRIRSAEELAQRLDRLTRQIAPVEEDAEEPAAAPVSSPPTVAAATGDTTVLSPTEPPPMPPPLVAEQAGGDRSRTGLVVAG